MASGICRTLLLGCTGSPGAHFDCSTRIRALIDNLADRGISASEIKSEKGLRFALMEPADA